MRNSLINCHKNIISFVQFPQNVCKSSSKLSDIRTILGNLFKSCPLPVCTFEAVIVKLKKKKIHALPIFGNKTLIHKNTKIFFKKIFTSKYFNSYVTLLRFIDVITLKLLFFLPFSLETY